MNKVGRHTGLDYRRLPKPFKEEMKKYVEEGIETGSSLKYILQNDLFKTMMYSDPDNQELIKDVVLWIWNQLPSETYGTPDKVDKWLSSDGWHE
tara:strand:+ start:616 stop:897 length:282 start_codon:yes stop_codon:yes gene_type:complete